jgi:hypothetical protein
LGKKKQQQQREDEVYWKLKTSQLNGAEWKKEDKRRVLLLPLLKFINLGSLSSTDVEEAHGDNSIFAPIFIT